jgi:hypothetical protein
VTLTTRSFVLIGALGATLGFGAAPAAAQNPSRSFGGLFGGRAGSQEQPKQTLDLSMTLLQAYDDNILVEQGSVNPSAPAIGGWYTTFGSDGAYQWNGHRTRVGLTGGSVVRYYNDSDSVNVSATAGVGFATDFARRTTLSANQSFAYSPSYLTGLFPQVAPPAPGSAPPVGADFAVDDQSSVQYGSTVGLSTGLTQRGTLSGTVSYSFTDFIDASSTRTDQKSTRARVQFARAVNQNTSLRLAYRYSDGDLGSGIAGVPIGATTTENAFDFGVDYVRPLSATRRMTFSFGVGSSAADLPATDLVPDSGGIRYNAVADAAFGLQFQRSWEFRASYTRGLDYIPELAEPVYTNGFSTSLTGLLTRTMDLNIGAGISTGESAVITGTSAFDTYAATVRIRRSLTRTFAAYVEYVYYFYDFGTIQVQPGVPPTMERNGVRFGLTIWLPVVRR